MWRGKSRRRLVCVFSVCSAQSVRTWRSDLWGGRSILDRHDTNAGDGGWVRVLEA